MPLTETQLLRRLRAWTAFFIFGLVVSGLTAIPLETELAILERLAGQGSTAGGLPEAAFPDF